MIDDGVTLILIIPMLHLSRSYRNRTGENTEDYQERCVMHSSAARNISSERTLTCTNVAALVFSRDRGRCTERESCKHRAHVHTTLHHLFLSPFPLRFFLSPLFSSFYSKRSRLRGKGWSRGSSKNYGGGGG